jgi:hypothetical protein
MWLPDLGFCNHSSTISLLHSPPVLGTHVRNYSLPVTAFLTFVVTICPTPAEAPRSFLKNDT